jgi:N-acetylneuraminic acid mutarotase
MRACLSLHLGSSAAALLLTVMLAAACLHGEDPPAGEAGADDAGSGNDSGDGGEGGDGAGSDDGDGEGGSGGQGAGWTDIASLNAARAGHSSCAAEGRVYVFGGNDGTAHLDSVEMYDPVSGAWALLAPMDKGRYGAGCATVGSSIYVMGGETAQGPGGPYEITADVNQFDAATGTWTDCGGGCIPMPGGRFLFSLAAIGTKLYAIGGYDAGYSELIDVREYDTGLNTWTDCGGACAPMPGPGHGVASGVLDGEIVLAGGGDPGDSRSATSAFQPDVNGWSELEGMPIGRCCAGQAGAALDGALYIFGGQTGLPALGSVAAYDALTDSWSEAPEMPQARSQTAAAVLDGKVYVTGGHTGGESPEWLKSAAVFDPEGE